ncbi:patatin (plasmid) [Rhizobium grahamii CCGE 502]|uniref:Patatin n=1 Tax=Rhizobium grahamii CCGE 502 TaxID=990285 RepID=S3H663_9HYPH|nr:hypothetical protein [Rhizobium grahamii]EPE93745.1 patatin [Rhizobium grahamii CCGE 502]
MPEIIDRRNELSANLATSQELLFITKINELLAQHPSLRARHKPINTRVVELEDDPDYPSKPDRSSPMIERLLLMGRNAQRCSSTADQLAALDLAYRSSTEGLPAFPNLAATCPIDMYCIFQM